MEENKVMNHMHMSFDARTINEGFARMVVTAFLTNMNPTIEEVSDVKTAVSEAVTNAIIHGYEVVGEKERSIRENSVEQVELICDRVGKLVTIQIIDHGIGIPDVNKAMEPFYTTKPELDRSGMGFAFMEAFMDDVKVESKCGIGTKIVMTKYIGRANEC